MSSLKSVLILGLGVMGEAFLHHISRSTQAQVDCVNPEGIPFKAPLLPGSANLIHERDLKDKSYDLVIVSVSLIGFDWAVKKLAHIKAHHVLIVTKGLVVSKNTISTLTDYAANELNINPSLFCQVAGPCIAADLKHNSSPLELVLAGSNAYDLAPVLSHLNVQFKPSLDIVGVSWAAAFKNIYSIALGASISNSQQAALLTNILSELSSLIVNRGGQFSTAYQLAGIGDLWVTAAGGRNGKFGKLYQQTGSFSKAIEAMNNQTIEGVELAASIRSQWVLNDYHHLFPIISEWINKLQK
ncbi:MAG TPA: hypothetical protein QF353_05545 [Gammaproteobacteria bacterium]|nr:hypothetical protein [Gammaproteobacteria bacterium]